MIVALVSSSQALADYDQELAEEKAKCLSLLAEWRKPEKKNDAALRERLIDAAVRSDQPEIVEEVAAGGNVAGREIKLPAGPQRIALESLHRFTDIPEVPYTDGVMDFVVRRMTQGRFEAWTPKHGWLFNAKGEIINEALPPRRDGIGRSWHGAFLSNGMWITTDLWEMDKTLSFFSRSGKLVREVKAANLAPAKPGKDQWINDLIGWARSDQRGEAWIVSVGDGPGRTRLLIEPNGKSHRLEDENAPWKLCFPRDVEPKGMYTSLVRPSDDYTRQIWFEVPGHGSWSAYPTYHWTGAGADQKVIPQNDNNFGFLPGSYDVFIGENVYGNSDNPSRLKTWFFSSDGECRGWIRAAYLTDSPDLKAMWMLDEENCVVTLGLDLKPEKRTRFVLKDANAKPVKLFSDLHLGFFKIDKQFVLARW